MPPPLLLALLALAGIEASKINEITAVGKLGGESNITCNFFPPDIQIEWTFEGAPINHNDTRYEIVSVREDKNGKFYRQESLLITNTTVTDHGIYGCNIEGSEDQEKSTNLNLTIPIKIKYLSKSPHLVQISETAYMNCIFEGFNLSTVEWRNAKNISALLPSENMHSVRINETHINGTLKLDNINKKDNGTYYCGCINSINKKLTKASIDLLVLDKPQVSIDLIKAVGAKKLFFNWTYIDGNSPIEAYALQYRKNGTDSWTHYSNPIGGKNTSFVLSGLDPLTAYQLKISGKNVLGWGQTYSDNRWTATLDTDPYFTPDIILKGFTMSSVSIGWNPPPKNITEYVHYYELFVREQNGTAGTEKEAIHSGPLPYMFENLIPYTTYIFKVRSCSELTKECGEWSAPVNGSTLDALAGAPANISAICRYDNISGENFIFVQWQPPIKANGKVIRYMVEVTGNASFMNSEGIMESITFGPKVTNVASSNFLSTRFNKMPANTNYTVKVSAVTRIKRGGEPILAYCATPPSIPPRDSLKETKWVKVRERNGRWMFKLYIPRVSERNGAICCYRIFIVKMKYHQKLSDMPSPEHLPVSSYRSVHNGKPGGGVYIADMFTSNTLESDIILGDNVTYGSDSRESISQCSRCASILSLKSLENIPTTILTTLAPIFINLNNTIKSTLEKVESISEDEADIKIEKKSNNAVNVGVTALPADTATDKNEDASSVKPELEKILQKKKRKLENPDSSQKSHASQLSLNNIQDYQNTQSDSHDKPSPYRVSSNDEQDFSLNPDYYIKKRIYHQNKNKPYDSDDTLQPDKEFGFDMVLSDIDNESSDNAKSRLFGSKFRSEDLNAKFLRGHKIVTRELSQDNVDSLVENSSDEKSDASEFLSGDDRNEKLKNSDQTKLEDVDISLAENNKPAKENETSLIYDGPLDIDSNYTGFVELIVHSDNYQKMMPIYSDYLPVLKPGPTAVDDSDTDIDIAIKVLAGLVALALLVLLILCAIHERNRRRAVNQGVEMHTIQSTLRNIYQGFKGRRHLLIAHSPPDMPPIAKSELVAAFTERQADSGYGFQQEFELLPDSFPDRTMDASEAKENQGKNRYPDIKAYDQTRVKLSQIDSTVGSDYINANIVMGYKERKKFICAQGPTDVTVDDFWRMIWEFNLELVVMLTNLEEYSKVKCAKYWPDPNQQDMTFHGINVHHISEKRYSDYIIRELKISKQPLNNSNSNHHIIETNGAAKKNGGNEYNNGLASGTNDVRIVHQYHFLMWKDFVAPEYPYAILKFIKRMNEASPAGRPILIHCSAGVGRTGTLVALDCLLQQLAAEDQVAVFNTVCDLRRQRNFLVQSLKQYIFVYRALVEYGKYDDTEIPASRLKSTIDQLRQTAENNDTCPLEEEFEKLRQPILECNRLSSAGRSVEHLAKNRSDTILPYDHNRVILAPLTTKENSTYINATFVEGYNNSESYIITQDPLPATIGDFWRMVSEQEITTIVMLSELGEGKCPRYWDDDEIVYDHINVTYLLSESCPYYTRREFQVTNTKNMDRIRVTQLQYHGWPTVSGQVPEVTRGLIELLGQCGTTAPSGPTILVHCNFGTDRSSMFVALSILTVQLRTEHRVDISTVTRKLRSQRMGCLDTFLQYEFLHRAIVNYAELHNLLSDS